jgi:hypothetical protein
MLTPHEAMSIVAKQLPTCNPASAGFFLPDPADIGFTPSAPCPRSGKKPFETHLKGAYGVYPEAS